VQKYETNKTDFAEIFKSKSSLGLGEAEDVDLIGNLLLGEVIRVEKESIVTKAKYDEFLRKQLLDYLQQRALSSPTGSKFIELLFLNAFKLVNSNTKDQTAFLRHIQELFTEVFRLYEQVLAKCKAEQLHYILPTFLMVVELYHGSLVPLTPNQNIITYLLKAIEHMQKPEFNEALTLLEESEF
jgi:hypothetical protein